MDSAVVVLVPLLKGLQEVDEISLHANPIELCQSLQQILRSSPDLAPSCPSLVLLALAKAESCCGSVENRHVGVLDRECFAEGMLSTGTERGIG